MAIVTKVKWGRELTQSEIEQINAYITAQIQAGTTDGVSYIDGLDLDTVTVRFWTTSESATSFIAFENSIGTPPVSAQVL